MSTGHFFISILVSIPVYLRSKPPTCFQSLHSLHCRACEMDSLLMKGENKMCLEICEPNSQETSAGDQDGASLLQSVNLMSRADAGSSEWIIPFHKSSPQAPRVDGGVRICTVGVLLYICFPSIRYSYKPACPNCHCWRVWSFLCHISAPQASDVLSPLLRSDTLNHNLHFINWLQDSNMKTNTCCFL